jgi:ribosomal protein S18 acetylase RimI-like enzyme
MPGTDIRDAALTDLEGLVALETRTFASDRLSRRSLRRLVGSPSARLRVAGSRERLAGYYLVFFRKGAAVARLYSIAVAEASRGTGLGRRLLADAEAVAIRAGQRLLRLEVREENLSAIRLYEGRGYRRIGRYPRYYADGVDALRYEKALAAAQAPRRSSGSPG